AFLHCPGELFTLLVEKAETGSFNLKDKKFPKDVSWLWRRIKEAIHNLRSVGLAVSRDDSSRGSVGKKIRIERIQGQANQVENL
ncbi:MAG TPA: hypothetical protein VH878_09055, partial [Thermodesulfobacteriota bacterium]